jgi:hypothetical protein
MSKNRLHTFVPLGERELVRVDHAALRQNMRVQAGDEAPSR